MFPYNHKKLLISIFLSVNVLIIYWQVGEYPFINFDDYNFVVENPHVLGGLTKEGILWGFTTLYEGAWFPLTWISHMIDVELFGLSAGWHHRMNVLYHFLNIELLFFVLWKMTGKLWQSAFVAAFFGVHPLHVEPVAWISSRKDVLSTMFWILTMAAYVRYARQPSIRRFLPVVLCFGLGLMCKSMLVTLPFVLLLLDWWPLGRLDTRTSQQSKALLLLVEKLPLMALSIVSAFLTYKALVGSNSVPFTIVLPLDARFGNAMVSYLFYLGKTFLPSSLSVYYPHPATINAAIPLWKVAVSIALLCGVTTVSIHLRHRYPYILVGWMWFLVTLIPVIGVFVQVSGHAQADRYTYIPLVGIFIAVAWGVPELLNKWSIRRIVPGALGSAAVLSLSVAAWNQAGYWRDNIYLFSRAIQVNDKNWLAWNSLGVTYGKLGHYDQSIKYYREALRIWPGYADAWINLGAAYTSLGHPRRAIDCYWETLKIWPSYAQAWYNLGVAFGILGDPRQAIIYYREALRIMPDYADAWNNLGTAYISLGQSRQAVDSFSNAIRINPKYADAWFNLGVAFDELGQTEQAANSYREAARYKPDDANAWYYQGLAYARSGQTRQAISCFQEALRIRPDFIEARNHLEATSEKLDKPR